MQTLFISDIHLNEQESHITKLFLNFLQQQAIKAEKLYILGDLFEYWAGDDDLNEYNLSIINALKQLSEQHVKIYFMPGNRDFLIGQRFADMTGCQLLDEPSVIDLYGQKTLLLHGDSLCTLDTNHLKFRKLSRHPLTKRLFLLLPLFIRLGIIKKIRHTSKMQGKKLTADIADVTPAAISQVMQQYEVKHLVHGHTHKPTLHWFKLQDQFISRTVLSDWQRQGNYLSCSENSQQLIYFNLS